MQQSEQLLTSTTGGLTLGCIMMHEGLILHHLYCLSVFHSNNNNNQLLCLHIWLKNWPRPKEKQKRPFSNYYFFLSSIYLMNSDEYAPDLSFSFTIWFCFLLNGWSDLRWSAWKIRNYCSEIFEEEKIAWLEGKFKKKRYLKCLSCLLLIFVLFLF